MSFLSCLLLKMTVLVTPDFNVLVHQAEVQTRFMVELAQSLETIARNREALLDTFCQDLVELVRVEGVRHVDRHILAERGSYANFVYAKIRRDWEAGRIDVPDSDEDDRNDPDDGLPGGFFAPDQQRTVHAPAAALAPDVGAPAFMKRGHARLATPENAEAGPSRLPAPSPSKVSPEKQKRAADPSTPMSKQRVKPAEPSPPEAGPSRPRSPRKTKASERLDEPSPSSQAGGATPPV